MTDVSQLMSLEGRRALLTGATGGIGRVIARTLAEQGANLLLVDRPGAAFARLIEELEVLTAGQAVQAIECDLEVQADRDELVSKVCEQVGTLDVLVNNAAFVGDSDLDGWATDFEQQSTDTWRRALEVNLTAAFDLCKGFAALLRESEGGSIINVASIYGSYGPDYKLYANTGMGNPAAYSASKGGLIQLTRWLATTLAPKVRANCISPGGVYRSQPESFVTRYAERTPLGRMAKEDDFRGAIAFLASDMSSYCTGQNLGIDGGWGIW